jgi:hypothetical protein
MDERKLKRVGSWNRREELEERLAAEMDRR